MSTSTEPKPVQTIHTILDQFRDAAANNRDLGDRFERLMLKYLQIDPLYSERFSNVWMWTDFPLKGNMGDVGIDLVAEERATGNYCAIQCKFYLPDHLLAKQDIDSFFNAAGKDLFTSCMIISTTDKWGKNAEDSLHGQTKPVTRLRVQDLDDSPVDWSKFSLDLPPALGLREKKKPRPHQQDAIKDVVKGLKEQDRGKLIMACGTGKTYTALCLAEEIAPQGRILFLVPSLALLSQTLREWTAESTNPIHSLAVCSDANIGKKHTKGKDDEADITTQDLAFPATTHATQIVAQYNALMAMARKDEAPQMTVVFSTYQSLAAVSDAQAKGLPEFDLIICDEAHRTTGVTLKDELESSFVKVHDNGFIKGKKRIYMTATPRVYGDSTKTQAKEANAVLCSMDDEAMFGPELHRLGFGEAVTKELLADYKVLVLAVDQKYISAEFQKQMANEDKELDIEDLAKLTGCWNGLQKQYMDAEPGEDLQPMRRAVAFARSIKDSKLFTDRMPRLIEAYREKNPEAENLLLCETDHVDGTMGALPRGEKLDWLKAESPASTCRILSNAKCLSEGVDVPALDAVLFLNPRKSIIDVVQSVGRVMRRAPGKQYGYIILPIGIPADMEPEEALKDNEKYKVVWQVLQALRSHDDRFNATINQIELNKQRPPNIQVIGVGGPGTEGTDGAPPGEKQPKPGQGKFYFPGLEEWKDAIYARIVKKCGDRRYWENWAKDVAKIAKNHRDRLSAIVESGTPAHKQAFAEFLAGLRQNLNPSITEDDAIDMLSQHMITRPVFDALFSNYAFTDSNPVSVAMQKVLASLEDENLEAETQRLEKFYASVRERASRIDNAEGRQKVVVELYEKFFQTAFEKVAKRLGIVYTPVEVVDFIIRSVEDVLRDEFGSSLSDKDVHVIDPFTGTGTFIVRLLQSGLIKPEDLPYKYANELHANEIALLAYYVAAVNIEEAYHGVLADPEAAYAPFEGIVLTDTFQLFEDQKTTDELTFPENNARVQRQKSSPIRVVIGNPPYNEGNDSALEETQVEYPALDTKIRSTYGEASSVRTRTNIYDSYIRAIRWASDRINDCGVVGFVTNASFIDGKATDGLRACLADEFTSLYVFNLRGNQRTSGDISRQEGGKIFGSGSRAPIAITLLVKNPSQRRKALIHYRDIGDYLSRDEKLRIIQDTGSTSGISNSKQWTLITPNEQQDWINQRDAAFAQFIAIGDKTGEEKVVAFSIFSDGVKTNRDAWLYNFSTERLRKNVDRMIGFFNSECDRFRDLDTDLSPAEFVTPRDTYIRWDDKLLGHIKRGTSLELHEDKLTISVYRPFAKHRMYFDKDVLWSAYRFPNLYPLNDKSQNMVIATSGAGKEFFALMINTVGDYGMNAAGRYYPRYSYEPVATEAKLDIGETGTDGEIIGGHTRRDAITDAILKTFREAYGEKVAKEDIFYYVYGIFHSHEYRRRFAADLKKMLPRIPMTKETADFWAFSKAGRELAEWHLNYETIEPYHVAEEGVPLLPDEEKDFLVTKMSFGRPTAEQKAAGLKWDKTVIVYNSKITLRGIPLEAYDYVVNGKPAIEWIMERYQVTRDKDSGIVNDPNDWSREHNQPRYILDLVKRIIRVSLETNRIVAGLPALNESTS